MSTKKVADTQEQEPVPFGAWLELAGGEPEQVDALRVVVMHARNVAEVESSVGKRFPLLVTVDRWPDLLERLTRLTAADRAKLRVCPDLASALSYLLPG